MIASPAVGKHFTWIRHVCRSAKRLRYISVFGWAVALVLGPSNGLAQSLTISTFAGQSTSSGNVDGTGTNARFNWFLDGLATDAAGNLFVCDTNNHTIRRVTPAGQVTTLAGAPGLSGHVDGVGAVARFSNLKAIACDPSGSLYVGDGPRVRKISASGEVTTVPRDSAFPSAIFDVTALAFDSSGNLYAALFHSLSKFPVGGREITLAGSVQTGSTDGVGSAARFGLITGIVVDQAGNLYVADSNHTIRKVTPEGVVTTLAGLAGSAGFADGAEAEARFNGPSELAIDSGGNLYVADLNNHAVRRITPAGVVTTVAGGTNGPPVPGPNGPVFPDGVGSEARFSGPNSIAIHASGAIYIADRGTIRKGVSAPVAARIIAAPQDHSTPTGQRATFSVVANGNPAVSYRWQQRSSNVAAWSDLVNDATFSGTTTAVLVVKNASAAMHGHQFRCVVSNASGIDASTAATLEVDPVVVVVPLKVTTLAGDPGAPNRAEKRDGTGRAASFIFPSGVALDAAGNTYVAEAGSHSIRKITPDGVVTTFAGNGRAGSADGVGLAAQFNWPSAIAVDGAGNVFVADAMNGTIRKITPAGMVSTLAGVAGSRSIRDGTGAEARFAAPSGLVFDRSGNLMVIDSMAAASLRRITPAGVVTSIRAFRDVYPGPDFSTQWAGIARDANGNVYFTNSAMHIIEKRNVSGHVTTFAGKAGVAGSTDGRAANARFNAPTGIAVDRAGNIYVAEVGAIRKITPAGLVSTVAGIPRTTAQSNPVGTSDGIGSAARFNDPHGLALDREDNLYIADSLNNAIRKAKSVGSVGEGETVMFSVVTTDGSQPSFQWLKNGAAIAGATSEQLTITAARVADAGEYSVQVTTAYGSDRAEPVRLSVGTPTVLPPSFSQIGNLSIRAGIGAAAPSLIVGFVIDGEDLPLLVRGVGPGLTQFGVATAMADPRLALYAGQTVKALNDNWSNAWDIADVGLLLGAFPLAGNSLDAALLAPLSNGDFTVQCSPADPAGAAAGVVLVELYNAGAMPFGRLINVSARSHVGAGDDVMIAGFSINGKAALRVLIRAVGPGLRPFGVTQPLDDPQLKIVPAGETLAIASNDNWGGTSELASAFVGVGAFPLEAGSRDAVVIENLAPGAYTAIVSGVAGSTGEALVEVYELKH